MRLNLKLLLPWALFSLVLIAGFSIFQWQFNHLQSDVATHLQMHQDAVRMARDLRFLSQERLTLAQNYRGGPVAPVLSELEASETQTQVLIDKLQSLLVDLKSRQNEEAFGDQGEHTLKSYALARESLPLLYREWLNAEQINSPQEPVKRIQLVQQFQVVRAILDDLAAYHEITQQVVNEETQAQVRRSQKVFYGIMGLLLSAVLGFSLYQGYTVALPLHQLSRAARALSEGETAHFEVTSSIDEVTKLSQSLRDMLDKLQASHAEVQRQEDRFHRVLMAMPIGMVVVNREGHIVLVNAMIERLFGHVQGQLEGQPIEILVPARYREHHVGLRDGFLAAPSDVYLDARRGLTGQRSDGSEFPVEIGLTPIDTGEGPMMLAVVVDVTERLALERDRAQYQKRLENDVASRTAELTHKTAELELALKDLESFSYSISHDLRAPLRAIDGFVEMLLEDHAQQMDDEGRRMFGVVQENARKMGQLIDDILAFSRAGRLEMNWQDIDMNELLREVWKDLASACNGHEVRLEAQALPLVKGDPRAVRQILTNLLGNAIKFSRQRDPSESGCRQSPKVPWCALRCKTTAWAFGPSLPTSCS